MSSEVVLSNHIVNNRVYSPLLPYGYFFRLVRYYVIVMRMSNVIHFETFTASPR